LRFQVPVNELLAGRACGAVAIFDCPAVIERRGADFQLWTHASYSEHLRNALANAYDLLQGAAPMEAK
jgi:hypothetical protein